MNITHDADDMIDRQEFLIFMLSGQEYGIEILKVQEIRGFEPEAVTRIVNAPEYIKGVMNLRGEIIPIFDLRLKLNMSANYDAETVVVILTLEERTVGIIVDSVSDVLMLSQEQRRAAPNFGTALSSEYISGIGQIDERMIILIEIERLMSEQDVQAMDDLAQQ